MINYCFEKWNKNARNLKNFFISNSEKVYSYLDLVKITIKYIFNDNPLAEDEWDIERIIEINHGDYQGTLLYLIPANCYQPLSSDYLMTYIEYGSCSLCDTLLNIEDMEDKESQILGYFSICKDIVLHTIKPYNYGWSYNEKFCYVQ